MTSDLGRRWRTPPIDDPHTALRLAAALPRWWRFRGRDVAGRQWLRRLLAIRVPPTPIRVLRAWAQLGVAQLAAEHGAGAEELLGGAAALADFREAGDVTGELAARTRALRAVDRRSAATTRRAGTARRCCALAGRHGPDPGHGGGAEQPDLARDPRWVTWPAARRRLAAVDRLAAQCGEQRLRVLARANLAEVARLDGPVRRRGRPGPAGGRRRWRTSATRATGAGCSARWGWRWPRTGGLAEAAEVLAELRAGADAGAGPRPTACGRGGRRVRRRRGAAGGRDLRADRGEPGAAPG